MVFSPSWADDASSNHHDHAAMSKPKEVCTSIGLDCASMATPYLTNAGTLWLTWVASGTLSVAHSEDGGKHFSPPTVLAQHGKSMDTGGDARPYILETQPGHLLVAYDFFRDDKWNAQINLIRSVDGGKTFSNPAPLISGGVSERFPSMIKDRQGNILIAWVDKRLASKKEPEEVAASILYAWSEDEGVTFRHEEVANPTSCECCRIAATLDQNGDGVIAYRGNFPGGIRDHALQWVPLHGVAGPIQKISDDHWRTKACPHQGPALAISEQGTVHAAWFSQGDLHKGIYYAYSTDQGKSWSKAVPLGQPGHVVSRPYLLTLQNRVWLVWKEFDGNSTSVMLSQSQDDGLHWSAAVSLLETKGYSDHPLLFSRDNHVYLSWLTRAEGYHWMELP